MTIEINFFLWKNLKEDFFLHCRNSLDIPSSSDRARREAKLDQCACFELHRAILLFLPLSYSAIISVR